MDIGKFIVLEGIDGSGITVQAETLRIWFESQRLPVFVTKEPTRGLIGGLLNGALDHRVKFDPHVMALLFAADRIDHVHDKILPELRKGSNVICDRYLLSGLAYQSLEVDFDWVRSLNSPCPAPDLTIFLDVPVEVSIARSHSDVWRSSDQVQLYEGEATLSRVRQQFLKIIEILRAEGHNIVSVDGTQSITNVRDMIIEHLQSVLHDQDGTGRGSRRSAANPDISQLLRSDR